MAKKENDKDKKGAFGAIRLSVSKKYLFPDPRRTMMVIGGLGCLTVLVYLIADLMFLKSSVTTSGPLSSFHAKFEKDCASCHTKFESVTNAKCSVCHEKTGDELGIYTLAAHEVYRSGDLQRITSSAKRATSAEKEHACFLCHQEHEGREALITSVPDSRCTDCHVFGSFNKNHPQFEFAAKQIPDDSTMKFTHIRHVQEVVKREKLVDIERACLYCHNPQPDGKNFSPIAFEAHCGACHLTPNMETPPLRIKDLNDPAAPGVETLEALRARRSPGTTWVANTNPNEFKIKPGNRLVKAPIYHEDPWIMENLKMIRRRLYPDLGFVDLLKTIGNVSTPNSSSPSIYNEAMQTLQDYATGLRGRPELEVQRDLARIDSLLKMTQKKLRRQPHRVAHGGRQAMANFKLVMPPPKLNPSLAPAQIQDLNLFVEDLTKPCQECHVVANAGISRVRNDQKILFRAEFNHRAHILQRRCLECHTEIPIVAHTGNGTNGTNGTNGANGMVVSKSKDRAAIQNIPAIENCRACHNANETSNRCVTCHYFHPNKTNRSSMLLYLD
jgi:hypothetical protein